MVLCIIKGWIIRVIMLQQRWLFFFKLLFQTNFLLQPKHDYFCLQMHVPYNLGADGQLKAALRTSLVVSLYYGLTNITFLTNVSSSFSPGP